MADQHHHYPGVRHGELLGDEGLVIRGGLMVPSDLERAAEVCRVTLGYPGISVYAANDLGLSELVMASGMLHSQLRRSTPGRLGAAGFELVASGRWPHYTVRLEDASGAELERLRQAFSLPEPNPRYRS